MPEETKVSLYTPKDTFFHHLNPLVKGLMVVIVTLTALTNPNYLLNILIFIIGIIILTVSKVIKKGKFMFWLLFIIIAAGTTMHALAPTHGGEVLLNLPYGFAVRKGGLIFAATLYSKVAAIVSFFLILIFTTDPSDLVVALEKKGVPQKIGFIYLSLIQMIPELEKETYRILNSQKSRGLKTGSIKEKLTAYIPLFGPIMMGTLFKSSIRSMALSIRGFSIKGERTHWREVKMDKKDKRMMVLFVVLFGVYIIGRISGLLSIGRWWNWILS